MVKVLTGKRISKVFAQRKKIQFLLVNLLNIIVLGNEPQCTQINCPSRSLSHESQLKGLKSLVRVCKRLSFWFLINKSTVTELFYSSILGNFGLTSRLGSLKIHPN